MTSIATMLLHAAAGGAPCRNSSEESQGQNE